MASTKLSSTSAKLSFQQLFGNIRSPSKAHRFGRSLKDLQELLSTWIANFDFEWNSPHERFIHQFLWLKVGREKDDLLKRNRDLLARG